MEIRPRIPKLGWNKNTKFTIRTINTSLKDIISGSVCLEDLCHNVYVAAIVARTILRPSSEEEPKKFPIIKPPWEERIEKKITNLKRNISHLPEQ